MAAQTPAMFQNENLHIPRGKAIDGGKTAILKPEKKERKERKALADLSKPSKPVFSAARKGSMVKGSEMTKIPLLKNSILTNEEVKKCHEWAKEGVERVHFTSNDMQKYEKEAVEKRIKKKVDMVMSSLSKWNNYDYVLPLRRATKDIEIIERLELEPEIPLHVSTVLPITGEDEMEEREIIRPLFEEQSFEFKLKEVNDDGVVDFLMVG